MTPAASPLEILSRHFAAQGRRAIVLREVAEDGGDLTLYARPMTMADHALLGRYADAPDFLARVCQLKLEREDGTRAFGLEDLPTLKASVSARLIQETAGLILEGGPGRAELGECCAGLWPTPCAASTPEPAPADAAPCTPGEPSPVMN